MFGKHRRTMTDDAAAARRNTEAILRQLIALREIQELILATLGTVSADATRFKVATDGIIAKQKSALEADAQTIAGDQQTMADLHNQEIPDALAQQIKDAADTAEAQLAAMNPPADMSGATGDQSAAKDSAATT